MDSSELSDRILTRRKECVINVMKRHEMTFVLNGVGKVGLGVNAQNEIFSLTK